MRKIEREKGTSRNEERRRFLEGLRRDIKSAFDNPLETNFYFEGATMASSQCVEEAKGKRDTIGMLGDEHKIVLVDVIGNSDIYVDSLDDYPELLRSTYQELKSRTGVQFNVEEFARKALYQEQGHIRKSSKHTDLTVKYGARVMRDSQRDRWGITPQLFYTGSTTVGVYRDIVGQGNSVCDKIITEKQ